ncbi:hypothetical protein BH09ACT3_BH09ACT3_01330 [soil metagenome]
MRRTVAFVASLAVLAALTACSSQPAGGCSAALPAGDASSVVTSAGRFGTAPRIDFPTPLYSSTSQSSVLIAGDGERVGAGQPLLIDVTILNGTDGAELQTTSYSTTGGTLLTAGDPDFPAIGRGVLCATVGSRLAIVGSAEDSHGGLADETIGIRKDDAFVYVVDIKEAFAAKADGAERLPVNGLPAVSLAPDGTPGLTFSGVTAPEKLSIEVTKAGDGPKVKKDSYLLVKYSTFAWGQNPTMTDSNWNSASASVWQIGSTSIAPALSTALTGKRVGSQVLIAAPADVAGTANGGTPSTPLVFVVDILGIVQ